VTTRLSITTAITSLDGSIRQCPYHNDTGAVRRADPSGNICMQQATYHSLIICTYGNADLESLARDTMEVHLLNILV
jgi:hypothetical protein